MPFFVLVLFLDPAVEEEGDVCVFLGFWGSLDIRFGTSKEVTTNLRRGLA